MNNNLEQMWGLDLSWNMKNKHCCWKCVWVWGE